jgi:hypothetical protein
MSPLDLLIERIRGEYNEMPGLRLTLAQACRLWQVDAATCELLLDALLTERFLTRTADGAFIALPNVGSRPRLLMAGAQPIGAHSQLRHSA